MAIAHVHTDTQTDAAAPATLTITLPTGVASTDLVIVVIGSGRTGGTCGSYTAPSGWTAIGSVINLVGGQGHTSLQAWWAFGNIASLGFTKSGLIDSAGSICVCFSGADQTTPIDATGTANSNTGAASLTANAVTIATTNAWELIAFGDWNSGTITATGFTVSENVAANESAALLYNTTPKSTGSTGTTVVSDSASGTNQNLIAIPFAIRPAAVADTLMAQCWC